MCTHVAATAHLTHDGRSIGVLLHELVLKRLPAPLDGEGIEVAPVPEFEHADALLQKLLRRQPSERVSAMDALLEPFLCETMAGSAQGSSKARLAVLRHEIKGLHQSQGWEKQNKWHQVNVTRIPQGGVPNRDNERQYVCVRSVLDMFAALTPQQLKKRLCVSFTGQEGEVGNDYGGLTTNMYREFWDIILDPESPVKLFEGRGEFKLPAPDSSCDDHKVVGKLMMKALYGSL